MADKKMNIKWTTYTGTEETAPEINTLLLLYVPEYIPGPCLAALTVVPEDGGDLDGGGTLKWNTQPCGDESDHLNLKVGDRWSYLPTAPEVR